MLHAATNRRQGQARSDERHRADRHIDVEDPAPAPAVGNRAAEQRTDDRGAPEDRGEEALPTAAFGRGEDIADDRERDWHQRARAQSLNTAEEHELTHVLAESRKRGTNQEDDHAADEE